MHNQLAFHMRLQPPRLDIEFTLGGPLMAGSFPEVQSLVADSSELMPIELKANLRPHE